MKKRIIALFLASVMVLSMVACGKKEDGPKDYGVTLGQYKGLEVEKMTLEVSEEDVQKSIYTSLVKQAAATERTEVILYDVVNIDYKGILNGEAFNGGTAEAQDLQIGSGQFIPGFEDKLIGHSIGESFSIDVTFPEDYGNAELAGKAVVFEIKLNSIKAIPELTDEFVAENTSSKTYDEYKAAVRKELEESAQETIQNKFESDVIDKALENCSFEATSLKKESEEYAKELRQYYEDYAKAYNTTLEVFLYYFYGITLEYFESTLPEAAEYSVKCEKLYGAIAQAENLTITDEEYKEYVEQLMIDYKLDSVAKVEETYGKELIQEELMTKKSRAVILDSAVAKTK